MGYSFGFKLKPVLQPQWHEVLLAPRTCEAGVGLALCKVAFLKIRQDSNMGGLLVLRGISSEDEDGKGIFLLLSTTFWGPNFKPSKYRSPSDPRIELGLLVLQISQDQRGINLVIIQASTSHDFLLCFALHNVVGPCWASFRRCALELWDLGLRVYSLGT